MIIRRITIQDFGGISFYDVALTRLLNVIDSCYTQEISAAVEFFLCSKARQAIPSAWIRPTTRLTAEVLTEIQVYTVTVQSDDGELTLVATDADGAEATDAYQYLLSHCPEQDAADRFDGQDKTLPRRLCWYGHSDDAPDNLSDRTGGLSDMKTFCAHVMGYIKAFQPEPIHCKKDYRVAINPKGQFEVCRPGACGKIILNEMEEKLFLYVCFLNITEFWAEIENIRDLHHETKPLVIRNFLEFLNESVDNVALMERTMRLQRQVIVLTRSLREDEKKAWCGRIC